MKNRLCKSFVLIMLLLVTFFSIKLNSYAASFAYKDFKWEEFAEENKSYWISACDSDTTGTCVDKILATKERFYTRLYELLADVQNRYGFIDDNIIIATVFYGLTDESFSDPNDEKYNPYKLDDDDASATKNKYIGSDDGDLQGAIEYFKNEEDTLKTLVNNFIGYKTFCYGEGDETPQQYKNEQGTLYYDCPNDAYDIVDNKCVIKLDEYKGSFYDSLGLSWIGTDAKYKCNEIAKEKGYNSSFIKTNSTKEIDEKFFWDFLENENYLDSKDHLQEYYTGILGSVKKSHMNELEPDEIIEHKEEIIEVRKRLITGIKEVLKYYENVTQQYNTVSKVAYWWPIGSDSTTDVDGVLFAMDEPSKTYISSNYGFRVDPYNNNRNSKHNGIDIPGNLGVTNVIASQDGVVSYVENSCPDTPDENCGSGYGNHIIIEHIDGNYTVYAHLSNESITANIGDSVKKGQVIGKVGNSGKSTNPLLHFEVRVGGNDSSSAQDPLIYVSVTEPRASSISGEFEEWIMALEGTEIRGGQYEVHDAEKKGKYRTFGYGIVVEFNSDVIRAHGLDPSKLQYGSLVDKSVADAIFLDVVKQHYDSVKSKLSANNLTLNEKQVQALASLDFNAGNIGGFVNAFNNYGSTQSLCNNYWIGKSSSNYAGLPKRRKAECELFVNGTYNMNPYG